MIRTNPSQRTLVGFALLAALSGCDLTTEPAKPSTEATTPLAANLARVMGQVRDSAGNDVSNAKIHVYRGDNDSVPDTTVRAHNDGHFQVDLKPGKIKLFAEKDGGLAQSLGYSEVKANEVAKFDTIKLCRVLTSTFTIPGIQGSSFSVRIEGSPLEVSVSSSGTVKFNVVDGLESILIVSFTNKAGTTQIYKYRITTSHGGFAVAPVITTTDTIAPPKNPIDTSTAPTTKPVTSTADSFEIHPGSDEVADCPFVGSFGGNSSWATTNFGSRLEEGIGGAYDGNTIGRELWKYDFASALPAGRKILSVKLVWTPLYWGIRPSGGQDLTIKAHRMLVAWKEGHGAGQNGEEVSSSNDGASAAGPMYGKSWKTPMVGIDDVEAEIQAVATDTLPYNSLAKMSFDITEAVKGWIADPSSNNGLLFHSVNEKDGLYLDYPGFASDDHADSTKRPYLIVKLAPADTATIPVDTGAKLVVLQPGPEGQDDAGIIGTFTGNGSHDGNTQGADPLQSLGGSWDYNTIGRLLWKMNLPDSLRAKTIVSARAVFKVNKWLTRPLGGHDYKVEAFKMLRPWREGTGVFPGEPNNATLDGASSLGPRFGQTWNSTLVGFDGVDAEQARSSYAVLPWNDTTQLAFDFTSLVKFWLANPESNHGVVFRSLEELDPSFPNFPGFDMSDVATASRRPKIVIEYK